MKNCNDMIKGFIFLNSCIEYQFKLHFHDLKLFDKFHFDIYYNTQTFP